MKPKGKPRGRGFVKGDPRIAPLARAAEAEARGAAPPKPEPRPFQAVEGDGLLAAMRHVLVNDKTHDATEEQKEVRAWLKGSRPTFFAKKADLEKAEMLTKAAQAGAAGGKEERPNEGNPPAAAPDLGTDACLELIDDLLGETP